MRQLLLDDEEQDRPMQWVHFLEVRGAYCISLLLLTRIQVMRKMGFEYDPTAAGPSVRFDPPNPRYRVSSIHIKLVVLRTT